MEAQLQFQVASRWGVKHLRHFHLTDFSRWLTKWPKLSVRGKPARCFVFSDLLHSGPQSASGRHVDLIGLQLVAQPEQLLSVGCSRVVHLLLSHLLWSANCASNMVWIFSIFSEVLVTASGGMSMNVRICSTEERRLHTTCLETAKKALGSSLPMACLNDVR